MNLAIKFITNQLGNLQKLIWIVLVAYYLIVSLVIVVLILPVNSFVGLLITDHYSKARMGNSQKKGTKAVTGAVPFQKVNFCPF